MTELQLRYMDYFNKNSRYDKGDNSPGSYRSYLIKVGDIICEASSPQALMQLMVEQFEKQNLFFKYFSGVTHLCSSDLKVGDRVLGTILAGNNVYISDQQQGYSLKEDRHYISLEEAQIMDAFKDLSPA